jgi:hypothetical protein
MIDEALAGCPRWRRKDYGRPLRSTRRRRSVTLFSSPPWRAAWPRATTRLLRYWGRPWLGSSNDNSNAQHQYTSPPPVAKHRRSTPGACRGRGSFARHRPGAACAQGIPTLGQPMYDPGLNLLALAYRSIYAVVRSYIAARFAPHTPMRHALVLGVVGLVLSLVGAIVTITKYDLGPNWYPVALVLTALPCARLGGVLHRARHSKR